MFQFIGENMVLRSIILYIGSHFYLYLAITTNNSLVFNEQLMYVLVPT